MSMPGIYIGKDENGNDRVIHFIVTEAKRKSKLKAPCPNSGYQKNVHLGVVKTCFDCFVKDSNPLAGRSLHLCKYGVPSQEMKVKRPGCCSTLPSKSPEEVVKTATELHRDNGFGEYNLETNNCEDFATFCKTGVKASAQVYAAQAVVETTSAIASLLHST